MVTVTKINDKDYEAACLFKDFVRKVNGRPNTRRDMPQQNYTKPRHHSVDSFIFSENISTYYSREHMINRPSSPCMNSDSRSSSEYCSDYRAEGFSRMDYDPRNFRPRARSYDEGTLLGKLQGRVHKDSEENNDDNVPGFVCYYCDAKYVYKQCLLNHLNKSHRKSLNNCKYSVLEQIF